MTPYELSVYAQTYSETTGGNERKNYSSILNSIDYTVARNDINSQTIERNFEETERKEMTDEQMFNQ